jgi:hypothetical protein
MASLQCRRHVFAQRVAESQQTGHHVARFGHLTADDNEADAIALMVWAMKSGKAGPIEGIQFKRPRSRLKSLQPVKQKRAVPGRPIRRKK